MKDILPGLILVDGDGLKRDIRRHCQETLHRMERVRANLRQFHEENEPAFDQWLHSQFGRDMTRIRELTHRSQELRAIIGETEEYRFLARKSYRQAYEEVMRCRAEHDEPPADKLRREQQSEHEELWGENEEFEFDPQPEDEAYHEHADRKAREDGDRQSQGDSGAEADEAERDRPRPATSGPDAGTSRLKTLYRQLARKLHPDVNVGIDQKRRDLWNEVQAAYERGDVDRLETLSAMGEVFDGGFSDASSVWSLRRLQTELAQGLWQLERQVRRLTKEPAWGFKKKLTKPGKLRVLSDTYAKQFEWMRRDLEHDVIRAERTVESWKNAREKRSSAR